MVTLGDRELGRYPFLADAGQKLKEYGFTLEQLSEDSDLEPVRQRALRRIRMATEEGRVDKSVDTSDPTLPLEVLSFLLAIVLLKLSGARHLIRRFALQEARRAEAFLERDLGAAVTETQVILTTKIIHDLAGIEITKESDSFVIPIPDYLRRAVLFHAREWKLVNRSVRAGRVYLTPHETVRLIRQEMTNYINSKISSAATPQMVPGLQGFVKELMAADARLQPKITWSGVLPPCVKHAMETMRGGENLSHAGRFLLATYMIERGHSINDIKTYFEGAPDYNESITMYQLRHLSGESGSNTKYRCQSCAKLRTLNLCYAIPECDGISSPLQFGTQR